MLTTTGNFEIMLRSLGELTACYLYRVPLKVVYSFNICNGTDVRYVRICTYKHSLSLRSVTRGSQPLPEWVLHRVQYSAYSVSL